MAAAALVVVVVVRVFGAVEKCGARKVWGVREELREWKSGCWRNACSETGSERRSAP